MGGRGLKGIAKVGVLLLLLMLCTTQVLAAVGLANSRSWTDVYSVMLHSALNDEKSYFMNSESIVSIARVIPQESEIIIYQSDNPYVPNLRSQMESAGYTVIDVVESNDFNLELAPEGGERLLFAEDSFRLAAPTAAYATQTGTWVYIVNEERLEAIAAAVQGSQVLAIGNFRRDYLNALQEEFDTWINNNNIFRDSQDLAQRFPVRRQAVVLTDGTDIEQEYFETENPVVLSGGNKLVDETFAFLTEYDYRSVIVVGNRLATVGEQIRSRSDRTISVFVKFGQSDSQGLGRIYALSLFPLPTPNVGLTVNRVAYDPQGEELVAYFNNTGNTGVYALSTISVKSGDQELGSVADVESVFLGAGEILPVQYELSIDAAEIDNGTQVEFFTSYGQAPTTLDQFLTMRNRYGPPFALPLEIESLSEDPASVELLGITYYDGLKRIGVDLSNTGSDMAYYRVRINQLIVNGLPTDLVKAGSVRGGETATVYLPVELDEVDLVENEAFNTHIVYGSTENALLKSIRQEVTFTYEKGGLFGSLGTLGPIAIGGVILLAIIMFILLRRKRVD